MRAAQRALSCPWCQSPRHLCRSAATACTWKGPKLRPSSPGIAVDAAPDSCPQVANRAADGIPASHAASKTCRIVTARGARPGISALEPDRLKLAGEPTPEIVPGAPGPAGEPDPGKGEKDPAHQQQASRS